MDIWKKNEISDDLDLVDFEEDVDNILSELEASVVMLESAIFVKAREGESTENLERIKESLDRICFFSHKLRGAAWVSGFAILHEVSYLLYGLTLKLEKDFESQDLPELFELILSCCNAIRKFLKKEIYGLNSDAGVYQKSDLDNELIVDLKKRIGNYGGLPDELSQDVIAELFNKNICVLMEDSFQESMLTEVLEDLGYDIIEGANTHYFAEFIETNNPFCLIADPASIDKIDQTEFEAISDLNFKFIIIQKRGEDEKYKRIGDYVTEPLYLPVDRDELDELLNDIRTSINQTLPLQP